MSDILPSNPLALVIEDDEKLAVIFSEAMKKADFETIALRDGLEAQQQLAISCPSVVVLDLRLPEVPGERILQTIRADPRLSSAQVIIVTADPRAADSLYDQADLVLIKPVSFSQLRDLASRIRQSL
jgi:CheY-like chemotaxis protein